MAILRKIRFLNVAIFMLNTTVNGRDTYVVQTNDFVLHFVTDRIESYPLDLITSDGSANQNEHHSVQQYNANGTWNEPIASSLVPKIDGDAYKESIAPGRGYNTWNADGQKEKQIRKVSRVDRIVLDNSGLTLPNGRKIYIEDLLMYPMVDNGIYLSATQDHIPRLINNTMVVIANFKVYILDLYDYSSKTMKFNQILHLYDTFMNLNIVNNRIFLNGRSWDFDAKINAVFILKEKDGFNFMLRVMDGSEINVYRPCTRRNYRNLVLAIFPLIFMIFYGRNLKYGRCVSKREKVYLGAFVKEKCLIYQVNACILQSARKICSVTKHCSMVNVLYDGSWLFWPIIVTERTFQLNLSRGNNNALCSLCSKTKESIRTIVEAIEFLHSKGIVHSRICPENFRVTEHGHVRVQSIFTNVGWRSIGQLRNVRNMKYETSVSDDVFSLGCVIHYYLTGFHPFDLKNFVKVQRKSNKTSLLSGESSTQRVCSCSIHQNTKCTISKNNGCVELLTSTESGIQVHSDSLRHDCSNVCNGSTRPDHGRKYGKIQNVFSNCHIIGIWRKIVKYIRGFSAVRDSMYFDRILDEESTVSIEYNILFSTYKIRIEDQVEHDLVYHCLRAPSAQTGASLSNHPYFWDFTRTMDFICDVSDFVETSSHLKPRLERHKRVVFEGSWIDYLDPSVSVNVKNRRSYDYHSLCDLVRFIRNCQRHYQELKNREFFEKIDGRTGYYFTNTFPELFMFLYRNPVFRGQHAFEKYY